LSFYTNVLVFGNHILYRGIDDKGKRIKEKFDYAPSLYVKAKRVTNTTSLDGEYLEQKEFKDIRHAKDFIKKYDGVSNAPKLYGNNRFEYAFIADNFKGMVEWEQDKILIAAIDIEVGSENGFPDPYLANEPITAITIRYFGGRTVVFGCGDYSLKGDETYIKCKDEWTLCKKFLDLWVRKCPDIITGWNIKFFDIPYLHNRMKKILGDDDVAKLSPWHYVSEHKTNYNNKELTVYSMLGVSTLDYMELYQWYAPAGKSQESYRLDNITNIELGERKLSYDEYDSLHDLYKKNFQLFIEYNIRDVDLIFKLEDKLKLIELALTLAYDTKSNYEDVFAQTRMWDSMTYSYLFEKNIIVPPRIVQHKDEAFEGAYVKDPQVGKHDWVASFDLNSLYPHLMMQYNISPEALIEPENYSDEMREIISNGVSVEKLLDKSIDTSKLQNCTLTPNGQFFRTDIRGFLPQMLEEMYIDRKKYKKLMLKAQQELENETDEDKKTEIQKKVARYNNLQLAKKVSLNSAYGALGSQYFRFYDLRQALAVTQTGKLSIRWIEAKINEFMNKTLGTKEDYVIASDTDSIYLKLGPYVNRMCPDKSDTKKVIEFMDRFCEDKMQPFIDKSYQELAEYVHAYEQKMQMKREALADKGIWTAKKRYILNVYNNEGVQYHEPHMKVMGLEMIKSSTPSLVRGKMEEAIKIMLRGTEDDVQEFIRVFKEEFCKAAPEDISFPRGVKGIRKYMDDKMTYAKGTPIHVRGAITYNKLIKELGLEKKYPLINEGEKIKFTYLRVPNPHKQDVISFPGRLPPEFDMDRYIDYDTQYSKTFIEPIKVILDCMGWSTEKQSTLDEFFV